MAQTGYTPISIYYSATASNTPTAGNLVAGELAINTADGILYYKDSSGVVQSIASKAGNSGSFTNLAYTGTLTGGTGVVNLGSGQFYKDASGNVGIGTASPSSFNSTARSLVVGNGSGDQGMTIYSGSGVSNIFFASGTTGTQQYNGNIQYNQSSNAMLFGVNAGVERMRIDSSGSLLVGTTSQQYLTAKTVSYASGNNNGLFVSTDTAGYQCITYWNRATSGTRYYCQFDQSTSHTSTGYIYTSDGTSTTYATTSDQRLKENIVDAGSGLEKISNVKIRSFDWISTKNKVDFGVIAQELYKVAPECVGVGEDNSDGTIDKPWSVDISFLVPALIKSVQELNAKVDAQATTIAALQAKVG